MAGVSGGVLSTHADRPHKVTLPFISVIPHILQMYFKVWNVINIVVFKPIQHMTNSVMKRFNLCCFYSYQAGERRQSTPHQTRPVTPRGKKKINKADVPNFSVRIWNLICLYIFSDINERLSQVARLVISRKSKGNVTWPSRHFGMVLKRLDV